MTTPAIGDSSDKVIELSKAKRIMGWYVDRSLVPDDPVSQAMPTWIEFLRRNPDATLPNGVGGAIVDHFTGRLGLVCTALAEVGRALAEVREGIETDSRLLVEAREIAKKYEDRYFETKAELDALRGPGTVTVNLLDGPNSPTNLRR